jgi:hypothetical protein
MYDKILDDEFVESFAKKTAGMLMPDLAEQQEWCKNRAVQAHKARTGAVGPEKIAFDCNFHRSLVEIMISSRR